jgi:hypothetical protein
MTFQFAGGLGNGNTGISLLLFLFHAFFFRIIDSKRLQIALLSHDFII